MRLNIFFRKTPPPPGPSARVLLLNEEEKLENSHFPSLIKEGRPDLVSGRGGYILKILK
jgi:hypothetical protein